MYFQFFRKDNPFIYFRGKRKEEKVKDNCFTEEELELLYQNFPQNTWIEKRDKVLLGLYVFQGIKSKEVKTVLTKDIDLDGYTILLKGDNRTNQRKIGLNKKQLLLLHEYLTKGRKKLKRNRKTDLLIITSKKANSIDSILYNLAQKLRKDVIGYENMFQIRRSVIKNWITKYELRKAQYLCGHKYISSTEKFISKDISTLSKEIETYFPL